MDTKKMYPVILFFVLSFFLFHHSAKADVPLIPENTTCKKIETEYALVENYNGSNPGITRACIGWAPNFPSTRVEGGQGTYFYFAYKLFPVPMPAYRVTTHDELGLNQSFQLNEPAQSLGACDFRSIIKDCKMYQPFLYYPAKWESRFNEPALSEFKGPYTVGPHEFYHYRYRGRLVPQQVSFHFDVVDPTGASVNIPAAQGTIVYDVPDSCYFESVIDIKDECRTIQFYIPTVNSTNQSLPEDATLGELPEERIRFYNPGEHTFRVSVDEKQMYRYQVDEGAEWQGKEGVYREGTSTPGEPDEKYVEIHKYAEGAFLENKYDPITHIGVGKWCFGHSTCSIEKADVDMTETVLYDKDGYTGILKEITTKKQHALTEGKPSDFKHYQYREMYGIGDNCYKDAFKGGPLTTHCDSDGPGYDYFQRGIYIDKKGKFAYTEWRQHSRNNGQFLGWPNLKTTDENFYGYEWKRYQIVGGIVKKKAGAGTESEKYKQYAKGPVKTHTLKTLPHGEIEWVNREDYKNHCYSEEDGFSKFGEWKGTTQTPDFNAQDSPAIVCFHNHSDDFHYWEFKWSNVRKFGGETRNGLLF